MLVQFPRNPIDVQDNLVFQTEPEEFLGHLVEPNFFVAPLLHEDHILGIGLDIHFSPLAKGKEGLQGTMDPQQFPEGRRLSLLLKGEELMCPRLAGHLLIGNSQ